MEGYESVIFLVIVFGRSSGNYDSTSRCFEKFFYLLFRCIIVYLVYRIYKYYTLIIRSFQLLF